VRFGLITAEVGDEAGTRVTLYGQEKDAATSTLARMNMILHNNPTALIEQGNTPSGPKFKDGGRLKTFDYVVANPPFSDKRWSTGIDPAKDEFERFKHFGVPPSKQGDYAYLLHIVRSLKSTGKGACILPHGVLFRGNAEADIRRALVRKGYIKGIIGLPPNLFFTDRTVYMPGEVGFADVPFGPMGLGQGRKGYPRAFLPLRISG
jgi:type I restriction enzyme M protein